MERGPRPEDISQIERLPKKASGLRKETPLPILREQKLSPPSMRQEGLNESRWQRDFDWKKKISLVKGFADLYITNKTDYQEVKSAIVARDLVLLKSKFSEVSKKKPDIADTVDKINNILLGDNPPWEDLDELFELGGPVWLPRKP